MPRINQLSCDAGRKFGHQQGRLDAARAAFVRGGFSIALAGVVAAAAIYPVRADELDAPSSPWNKFMQTLGLKKTPDKDAGINYTERSPLVVPPTRDLPPPTSVAPVADWPLDPPKGKRHAKVIPPNTAPVMDNPNPPNPKKSFFNPASWFNKEEYAPFYGEPPRDDLTDPPVGYRTPSPSQPYGVAPETKGKPVKAAGNAAPATAAAPPAAAQPAAQPAAAASVPPASSVPAQPGAPTSLQPTQVAR